MAPPRTGPVVPAQIVSDPLVMGGAHFVLGTHVKAEKILNYLRTGRSHREIFENYPSLPADSISVTMAWAEATYGVDWIDKPATPDLYPWHRKMGTGLAFREWLGQPTGLPTEGPIGLRQIDAAIRQNFDFEDHKDWQEAMILCIAELLRRGYGQALYDRASGSWEWTDRFICPDEFGKGPEGIGAAVVQSWLAFGDSGGAEDLHFTIKLPTGAPSME